MLLLSVALVGCEVLRLDGPVSTDGAWTTEGGTPARASAQAEGLTLPLEEKWVYNAEGAFGPAAALAADGRLFVATRQGEVRVLDLADERRALGIADLGDAIDGAPAMDARFVYVPLVAGRRGVVAYDFTRGRTAWTLDAEAHAAGLLLTDRTLVAASLEGRIRAIDPRTGAVRWEQAPDSARAVYATPVLLDAETIAVVDDQGRLATYALVDGTPRWTRDLGAPVYATPTLGPGGTLFVPTTRGRLLGLDAATGAVRWTFFGATPETRFTAVATDGRTAYTGTSEGTLFALDVAGIVPSDGPRVRWSYDEDGVVTAAPHLAGDTVFLGTLRKRVLALDAATGTVRWQTEVGGRVKTAPLVADGYLVVLAEPRQVYLFGPASLDSLATR
ncbi:MAG: PQQ-binding-like beta-propeller repeat protein [Bacteroidota bacterium]